MLTDLPPLVLATYGFLLLAIVGLWIRPVVWVAALAGAVTLGYATGALQGPALVWPALLAGSGWLYRAGRWRALAAGAVVAVAVLLGIHALPGFQNPTLVKDLVLSEGAAPYTRYLSFDKAVTGLLLLGLVYDGLLRSPGDWLRALRRAAPWMLANVAIVLGLTYALGYVAFEPKWTPFFWAWALTNLFFTCVAEEAFFRGFIQRELSSWLGRRRYGQAAAVAASAVLFGLVHLGGGWPYALMATLAGLGYALAFRISGSIEIAVLAHFGLNAAHFLLFTYPRLA